MAEHEHCGSFHIEKEEENHSLWQEHRDEIRTILLGAGLYIAAIVWNFVQFSEPSLAGIPWGNGQALPVRLLYLAAYVVLAADIYRQAAHNIRHGEIFDENVLMIVASIGAIVIGEYPEAVAVILFYRIGELFQDIAVDRSRAQISEALDLRPETVLLCRDGEEKEIPAEEARPGDQIRIRPGDRIPLDGIVTEGESTMDTAPLTGEPVPVVVKAGSSLLSGYINGNGLLQMEVKEPLATSMVSRVLDSVENASANKPRLERFITRFAKIYTPIVVIVAILVVVIPTLRGGDWHYWLRAACTFLVISCPCALVLSVPLSYFCGIAAASKRGILFKSGEAMEMISKMRLLVMDKTGTLTNGEFGLQRVVSEEPTPESEDEELETMEEFVLRLSAGAESVSTHPLAKSIVQAAEVWKLDIDTPEEFTETAGKGVRAKLPEGTVLCGSRAFLEEQGVAVSEELETVYGSEIYTALDGELIGRLLLADRIKEGAKSLVDAVHHIGGRVAILTGDKAVNADTVAEKLDIDVVEAELLPDEKLEVMRKLRKKGRRVFYVGDGINDAPVMAGADVSGAMGSGSDAAAEAADIVFLTSSLRSVEESIDLSFQTTRIAGENVFLALLIKLGVLFLGLVGYANMWFAVFADTGVAILCVLNAVRILYFGKYRT